MHNIFDRTIRHTPTLRASASILALPFMLGLFAVTAAAQTISSFPYVESFESGLGAWVQATGTDTMDWTRKIGTTGSSGTGPSAAPAGSYYLYTEASSPNYPSKVAEATAQFDFSAIASPQMTFKYHMYGSAMGTLNVDIRVGATWQNSVWSQTGQQHNSNAAAWTTGQVDLSAFSGQASITLRFRGVTGSSYTSDICVDNIQVGENLIIPETPRSIFYEALLNTEPSGWTKQGLWQFGTPLGNGALSNGNPDPTSGATGTNVFGVNLAGDYATTVSSPYYLTSPAIDCTGQTNVELRFQRWLNTDYPSYAHAKLEVSTNGASWSQLFYNSGMGHITDSSWNEMSYDLSGIADNQPTVYLRWSYWVGQSGVWSNSGWNIDDIRLTANGGNQAPIINDTPDFWINENSQNGTAVGTITATDPDAGDTITYTIIGGTGATAFAVDSTDGSITVSDSTQLDYETAPFSKFTLTIEAVDQNSLGDFEVITIHLINQYEAPVFPDQAFSIDENSINSTAVGNLFATDPDGIETVTFTLLGGTGASAFSLGAYGLITVIDGTQLDHEAAPILELIVNASEPSGLFTNRTITITINDVNEQPTAVADDYIAASTGLGTRTGNVLNNDLDPEDGLALAAGSPITSVQHGTLNYLNTNGTFSYTPDVYYVGSDSFSYKATDGEFETAIVTVTFTMQEDPDGDGLTNAEEQLLGTSPRSADTDGDGILDPADRQPLSGADPLQAVRALGFNQNQWTPIATSTEGIQIGSQFTGTTAYSWAPYSWAHDTNYLAGKRSFLAYQDGGTPVGSYLTEHWIADSWNLFAGWNLITLPIDYSVLAQSSTPYMPQLLAIAPATTNAHPSNYSDGLQPIISEISNPNSPILSVRAWVRRPNLQQDATILKIANSPRLQGAPISLGLAANGRLYANVAGQIINFNGPVIPKSTWDKPSYFVGLEIYHPSPSQFIITLECPQLGAPTTANMFYPSNSIQPWGGNISWLPNATPGALEALIVRTDAIGQVTAGTLSSTFTAETTSITSAASTRIYRNTPVWAWATKNETVSLVDFNLDQDNDKMPDHFELDIVNADPTDSIHDIYSVDQDDDYDGDGITNIREYFAQTSPVHTDTDGDGLSDAFELQLENGDPSYNLDPSMIRPFPRMWFSFNEAPGSETTTSHAPDTTFSGEFPPGGPLNFATGLLGNAIQSEMTVFNCEEINNWTAISVAFWIQANQTTPIFRRGDLTVESGGGYLRVELDNTMIVNENYPSSTSNWHHIIVSIGHHSFNQSGVTNVFIDGKHIQEVLNPPYSLDAGNNPLLIGFGIDGNYLLDDLRIYDFPLNIGHSKKLFEAMLDYDGDLLTSFEEAAAGTDPMNADTDNDGLTDYEELRIVGTNPLLTDTDLDTLPDLWEFNYGFDPLSYNDPGADLDGDGLTASQEALHNTNPYSTDTDNDLLPDNWEITYFTNPTYHDANAHDDADNQSNYQEYLSNTDPSDSNSFAVLIGDLTMDLSLDATDRSTITAVLGMATSEFVGLTGDSNDALRIDLDSNEIINARDVEIFDRLNALEDDPGTVKLVPIFTSSDEWEWQQ